MIEQPVLAFQVEVLRPYPRKLFVHRRYRRATRDLKHAAIGGGLYGCKLHDRCSGRDGTGWLPERSPQSQARKSRCAAHQGRELAACRHKMRNIG
jgi:hypothetical protein